MSLTEKKCLPCEGGIPPLDNDQEDGFMARIAGWTLDRESVHRIRKQFIFDDFKAAMGFVNRVAEIAEAEGHHPDLHIYYSKVDVELYTHAVLGLTENDFIVAAKIDALD